MTHRPGRNGRCKACHHPSPCDPALLEALRPVPENVVPLHIDWKQEPGDCPVCGLFHPRSLRGRA